MALLLLLFYSDHNADIGLLVTDLQRGECVSVYADVAGRCKRGLAVEFDGEKVFVGNGTALLSRRELFKPADGVPVR